MDEHQNPRLRPVANERGTDLVAVDEGKVPVEHDDVIAPSMCLPQRGLAVTRDVHSHPVSRQPARDETGELLLVLDTRIAQEA